MAQRTNIGTVARMDRNQAPTGFPLIETPARLVSLSRAHSAPVGSVLFAQGDLPESLHLLEAGCVHLVHHGAAGMRQVRRIAEAGDALDLSAVLTGEPLEVRAEVREACLVQAVSRRDFLRLLREDIAVSLWTAHQLNRELLDLNRHMQLLGRHASANERVIQYLLRQAQRKGRPIGGPLRIPRQTCAEIGDYLGMTRETVNRALADLIRSGIIQTGPRHLTIVSAAEALRLVSD